MPPKAKANGKKSNGSAGTLFQYMRRTSNGDTKATPAINDRRGSHSSPSRQANGKSKTAPTEGTEDDPLVISDDEAPRKKRKVSPSPPKANGQATGAAKDDSSDEEIEFILPPEEKEDKPNHSTREGDDIVEVTSCWICGKSLSGMDEAATQVHVNACLDSASAEAGPSKPRSKPEINSKASSSNASPAPAPKPQPVTSFASSIRPESPPPLEPAPVKGANAFSKLMNRNKETDMWKEASKDEKRDANRRNGPRKAPFYKVAF
ncbi:hypothetical protein A1Q1_03680 [Trichosporon asahii var. asahii CBS 2479]|uniref:UBZ4-type domain-containing protein n=1 Tax=Trichosporon asahii var. asahii (strain ATCC 90039 / CBS 2479 / JCM 2466 / KCTC 7840 / NBRC 103889/ NCYC 2677 / UAMH 7654) TaxID=1186058 RepID=J5RGR5_TRIAS|nr:hypothetical protein A1Q1_03680 [Trichosporon asahii var. asahii CBS 2479]EJT52548.1 hypothetical protein A1Q1_03680 [Trichosporon asahii var. asahii CBS 2479]